MRRVEELFDDFEDAPVASGSIGQVYRARLSAQGARNTGIDAGTQQDCTCGQEQHFDYSSAF